MRAAHHFERRQLHRARFELRLARHNRQRLGLHNRARQDDGKGLAHAHSRGAGAPPAAHRLGSDGLMIRLLCGGLRADRYRERAQEDICSAGL